MRYSVYVVQDVRTGYLTPTCDQNDSSAMRNFAHAVKQTSSIMNTFPGDFRLLRIGDYDSSTGNIAPCAHICIAVGTDFVQPEIVIKDGD